ncbi:TetR/AcrR family transcriptional regulator [Reinekea sp.]|jgi:AcrR family transcriptional regulator|uniref:TetR/AcrR family transcriptional regulator n=1 Tax=Reinekea sp. TaxID=1970455 RepID=UPI002A80AB89|nr:TetR/AcrR family transcriptional regulator [Reinekea sp.]
MAQNSKKDQIARAALPLFLEFGFKGSSVDMVVKRAGVSKPTVYNHFPDKTALLSYALDLWLRDGPAPQLRVSSLSVLAQQLEQQCFTPTALGLYRLVIGEGRRCPGAQERFQSGFDRPWRNELKRWAVEQGFDPQPIEAHFSHLLLRQLFDGTL